MSTPKERKIAPLAIIFDLDGTLIAEDDDNNSTFPDEIHLRPGTITFLKWLKKRGHSIALWTAASRGHARRCAKEICQKVSATHDSRQPCNECGDIFDFVWDCEKLQQQQRIPIRNAHSWYGSHCAWCGPYKNTCSRCRCDQYVFACPCIYVKNLKKVWKSKCAETRRWHNNKKRTLIVENTPQQCVANYGNAVYIPTFNYGDYDENIFEKMKLLIADLEIAPDVRAFKKCSHRSRPHACFEQDWYNASDY